MLGGNYGAPPDVDFHEQDTILVQTPSKPRLDVTPGAVVCVEAEIRGSVKIGKLTIVHPYARILATSGPIVIGESNIIEEFATIENKSEETMYIGSHNVFEVRSRVSASRIGDQNVFESFCFVGERVEVGSGTSFGAGTVVDSYGKCPDNSSFFGNPLQHRIAADRPQSQSLQIDFLSRILPNYHNVLNPKKLGL